ncbi:kinase-like domain-containing protein [Hyaloraphidium curvatum]|nr:kinase-like domain-containing protein [Hyaloraphidium curvatum]
MEPVPVLNLSSFSAGWTTGALLGRGAHAAVFAAVPSRASAGQELLVAKVALGQEGFRAMNEERTKYTMLRSSFSSTPGVEPVPKARFIPDFYNLHYIPPTDSDKLKRPFIILERLATSLDSEAEMTQPATNRKWGTLKRWALGMFDCLAAFHLRGYAHRDVKVANFGLRKSPSGGDEVVLFDLGIVSRPSLAKPDKGKDYTGTLPFLSIRAHGKLNPVFRDDLESLCYSILWLLGECRLPWPDDADADTKSVLQAKKKMEGLLGDVEELREWAGIKGPLLEPMTAMLQRVLKMPWNRKPDAEEYATLRKLLADTEAVDEQPGGTPVRPKLKRARTSEVDRLAEEARRFMKGELTPKRLRR